MKQFASVMVAALALAAGTTGGNEGDKKAPNLVIDVTEKNYEQEVAKSAQPVLIHFAASWAGPSRVVGAKLQQLAKDYAGKVKVCASTSMILRRS